MAKNPNIIYLKDYKKPDFIIETANLIFHLDETKTIIKSTLTIKRNGKHKKELILNGEELNLESISLNNKKLTSNQYKLTDECLMIPDVPDSFTLETQVKINPKANTKLEGLYISNNIFCTQCEPHGFRRITFFIDRPDVMTKFTTTIYALKPYKSILANGNLIAQGKNGVMHYATWEDPSVKSCYLFALVAGDLDYIEDKFITKSKRKVILRAYASKGQAKDCKYALESLREAMKWDEKIFGLEYDLNIFMIVAINDFNVGAMENKGLNLFNAKRILATPETATDEDFLSIKKTVAHEYFHNWTGNRITCRDWFQLSLKEGLTTFREQLFAEEVFSKVGERIRNANIIRSKQFAEDASPIAHPVQPKSYIEVNNLYTVTIYNKGAEIIRMLSVILGTKKFISALKMYYRRCDGKASTIDDLLKIVQSCSKIDLTQFKKWYDEAGTPVLDIRSKYDSKNHILRLSVQQDRGFHVPLVIGMLNQNGKGLLMQFKDEPTNKASATKVLNIKKKTETFQFKNIKQQPVLSLLRNFSAPIKINYNYSDEELALLMLRDSDEFNRWDAGQKFASRIIMNLIQDYRKQKILRLDANFINVWRKILTDRQLDNYLKSLMLTLPTQSYLIEMMSVADIEGIYHVTEFVKKELAKNLYADFLHLYKQNRDNKYKIYYADIGKRALKNLCLSYLIYLQTSEVINLCVRQYKSALNLNDIMGSLSVITHADISERNQVLQEFYKKSMHNELLVDKWLELKAMSKLPSALSEVKSIVQSPIFNFTNPNKVYALIRTFSENHINFHAIDGSGYEFLAEQVLVLDKINPLMAAIITTPLTNWRKFSKERQKLMREQLLRIMRTPKLSKNVYELVQKSI